MRQRLMRTLQWLRAHLPQCFGRNFDYRSAYRKADLRSDYWSIVGPKSKDEFQDLGRGKHLMLLAHGLTPQSRLLDIGCGTGQLTEVLAEYLSPQGLYYGTDIATEAIDFCRKKFTRANFYFVQNQMTHVPLQGLQFDFIYLGSVFTHMYPEEIHALLTDLKRLLAPSGVVIADAFVSPTTNRCLGGRGMVVIHPSHLDDVFATTGLQVRRLHQWEYPENVQRLLFHFTQP